MQNYLCGCDCREFNAAAPGKQSWGVPDVALMAITGTASNLAARFSLCFKPSPEELAEISFQSQVRKVIPSLNSLKHKPFLSCIYTTVYLKVSQRTGGMKYKCIQKVLMAEVCTCVNVSGLFLLSCHTADNFYLFLYLGDFCLFVCFVPSNRFKLMSFQNYIHQDKGEKLHFPNKKSFYCSC